MLESPVVMLLLALAEDDDATADSMMLIGIKGFKIAPLSLLSLSLNKAV